jgi:hypothetical protein
MKQLLMTTAIRTNRSRFLRNAATVTFGTLAAARTFGLYRTGDSSFPVDP